MEVFSHVGSLVLTEWSNWIKKLDWGRGDVLCSACEMNIDSLLSVP